MVLVARLAISGVMSVSGVTFRSRPGHQAPHAALPLGDQWPVSTDAGSGLQPKC